MLKSHNHFYWVCLAAISLGAAMIITLYWWGAAAETELAVISALVTDVSRPLPEPREKTPKQTVKGLYLTAYSASLPKKVDEIISLIDSTELNAVVVDIKDYTGYVLYDSHVPQVIKLKTKKNIIKDLAGLVKKFHDHKIYVIARQTVFQDPALAVAKPEWAVKNSGGGLWRDRKGLSWVDPTRQEVWNYNLAIAREAIRYGFDEINFDYVRFPSDGNMSTMVYSAGTAPKYQIMRQFYKVIGEKLAKEPVWISIDMFGLTMEATSTNDMQIGQRIVDAVDAVDYVYPMMYPSHYAANHLGFKNPADHPAEIFANGLKLGLPLFKNKRAQLRPWIQAFNIGAVYDASKIRAQINEIEKVSSAGWLMWNAANRYTAAGLHVE